MSNHNHAISDPAAAPPPATPSKAVARKLAAVAAATEIPFRVVLSNGAVVQARDVAPAFTLTFRTPARGAARRRFRLRRPARIVLRRQRRHRRRPGACVPRRLRRRLRPGAEAARLACATTGTSSGISNRSIAQAKANARFHYGLGRRSTGRGSTRPAMMYTCAYWKEGTTTLEEAQRNKMDHVCRKVQLKRRRDVRRRRLAAGAACCSTRWEHYGALGTGINATTEQVRGDAGGDRAPRARRQDSRHRMRFPRDPRPVRQAAVDRHARARRPRPAARGRARARRRR